MRIRLFVVLNSLSIDPGYIWKGNWRFFTEESLRTCDKRKPKDDPLQNVMEQGITFEEFLYLAECNGASIVPFLASNTTLAHFRSAILAACTRRLDDIRLVCSYNRSTLQQTGTGHFSPIAGYHAKDDLVLILDVARFKYPAHWISVELLWQSMNTIDPTTNKSRGFYLIAKWPSDSSIQCSKDNYENSTEPNPSSNHSLCPPEESLSSFIETKLRSIVDCNASVQSIIVTILQSLTPSVVPLTTKWTFDLMQKYRLNAVTKAQCTQKCQCVNPLQLYPSFLPANVADSLNQINAECKRPCARVTRTHVHAYAMPPQCATEVFLQLFEENVNDSLYRLLEQMKIDQYLMVSEEGKSMYLFGGFPAMIENEEMTKRVERALITIFFYALRSENFLANIVLFDSNELSSELQAEIAYGKLHFGL